MPGSEVKNLKEHRSVGNQIESQTISVIGLGYVGLPVAVEFAKYFPTVGFDLKESRVKALIQGSDVNGEVPLSDLIHPNLVFTSNPTELKRATFHIIAVPTPIDDAKQPDLSPLISASETVGACLKRGDIVVYESTVYPGVTEDVCVPVLERVSQLKGGVDFKVGYSPERINPGDPDHQFSKIKKVVSGQDEESLGIIAQVYGTAVKAGVFRACSIKVAEAAKVIENTQRDLNIALMNELSLIFDRMGIDTQSVLDAAGTKWNFLPFRPGLVGGHCIGVDPYYLTHKAEQLKYFPEVILAGRRINDSMGGYIARKTIKEMIHAGHDIAGSAVTVLGLTFKENCRDVRNTRVVDIIDELREYGVKVQVCDPMVDPEEANRAYDLSLYPLNDLPPAEAVIVAVAHDVFRQLPILQLRGLLKESPVVVDVKGIYSAVQLHQQGIRLWRL